MEGGPLLPVQGLGDKHVAADGIYVVNSTRRLIGAGACDAVADANVLILIRADLRRFRQTSSTEMKICSLVPAFQIFLHFAIKK